MSNSTNSTTTPPPSPSPFCLTCGFNFGHIADNVSDSLMGFIIVLAIVLVIVAIAVLVTYYCCLPSRKKKIPADNEDYDTLKDTDDA